MVATRHISLPQNIPNCFASVPNPVGKITAVQRPSWIWLLLFGREEKAKIRKRRLRKAKRD